jgi:hypothetical protein
MVRERQREVTNRKTEKIKRQKKREIEKHREKK